MNKEDIIERCKPYQADYMLSGRLKQDCEYFLGYGNRCEKHLWAGNVKSQIEEMKKLYNSFPSDLKPEWLSMKDIENYEQRMTQNRVIKKDKER